LYVANTQTNPDVLELKDPNFAAFLAWLIPGAGHLYQGRTAKGIVFMICILGTFFYGLCIGSTRVVYASWKPEDRRLAYLCQIGAGLPALPALVQAYRLRGGGMEPWAQPRRQPLWNGFMAPPSSQRELDEIHYEYHRYFELGTVYTMIAGLLNVLVIFDALGGPAYFEPRQGGVAEGKKEEGSSGGDGSAADASKKNGS
jgi:hypothetical protein